MNEKITLSGVPETMLQTLYARAKETCPRGAIRDEKAAALVERIDYDFSLADKDAAMHSGVIARTIVLDRLVEGFLAQHQSAAVVNLACGLDTRCYRVEGYGRWYNLDLPETMAVRAELLPESGKITQLAMSAMDDWSAAVEERDAPALVIIEGLTMYLSERDVQRIFEVIAARFPRVTVLVETMSPAVVTPLQGEIHRGQRCTLHMGRRGRRGACAAAAGLPSRGGAQPVRGDGRVRAGLPPAR